MEMDNMGTRNALLTFGICGITGVLVDIDYIISYYLIPEWSRHFLHTPLLVTSCLVLVGLGTYLGRLLIRMVLTNRKEVKHV
jgi:hypothetical protein